jgi:nitrogen fixation-related uncharacterized protein
MTINIPETYYDLKEGIEKGDSKVEYYTTLLQTTKEDLEKEYKQNSILYNGVSEDFSNELYIYATNNSLTKKIHNLALIEETQLDEVKEEIKNTVQAQGMYIKEQEMYEVGDISFVFSEIKNGEAIIYQYYTIVNGNGITISLNTSDSSYDSKKFQKIIDTIEFDEIQEKSVNLNLYILIGSTTALVIFVIILMFRAFSNKRYEDDSEDDEDDENSENK